MASPFLPTMARFVTTPSGRIAGISANRNNTMRTHTIHTQAPMKSEKEEVTFKASIKFNSRAEAQQFATAWSRFSKRGYTLSAADVTGVSSVILDGVKESDKAWINARIAEINATR